MIVRRGYIESCRRCRTSVRPAPDDDGDGRTDGRPDGRSIRRPRSDDLGDDGEGAVQPGPGLPRHSITQHQPPQRHANARVSTFCCQVSFFSARCHIYISRLCHDASPSVRLSVTEMHWRIIANLGFIFRSHFTAHWSPRCWRAPCCLRANHLAPC